MRDFRELKVWEKSHRLTLAIYKATATFPRDELYGLTSQIRRSSDQHSALSSQDLADSWRLKAFHHSEANAHAIYSEAES